MTRQAGRKDSFTRVHRYSPIPRKKVRAGRAIMRAGPSPTIINSHRFPSNPKVLDFFILASRMDHRVGEPEILAHKPLIKKTIQVNPTKSNRKLKTRRT